MAVQIQHGFGVGIGFARARFHGNVQHALRGEGFALYTVGTLYVGNIVLQRFTGK